jgi:hypothetical protein
VAQRDHHVAELAVLLCVRAGHVLISCVRVGKGYDVEYFARARTRGHKSLPFSLIVKNVA